MSYSTYLDTLKHPHITVLKEFAHRASLKGLTEIQDYIDNYAEGHKGTYQSWGKPLLTFNEFQELVTEGSLIELNGHPFTYKVIEVSNNKVRLYLKDDWYVGDITVWVDSVDLFYKNFIKVQYTPIKNINVFIKNASKGDVITQELDDELTGKVITKAPYRTQKGDDESILTVLDLEGQTTSAKLFVTDYQGQFLAFYSERILGGNKQRVDNEKVEDCEAQSESTSVSSDTQNAIAEGLAWLEFFNKVRGEK